MKKPYILLIVIFLLAVSCRKNFYKSQVNGRVIDEATGEGIGGIQVYLLGTTTSLGSSGPSIANESNYTYTASDGSFSFKFNRSEYGQRGYYLYAKRDQNKYSGGGSSADMIPLVYEKAWLKEKITKDIYLKPFGFLKVRFKHTSSDTAIVVGVSGSNGALKKLNGEVFNGFPPKFISDTAFYFIYDGNTTGTFYFGATLKNASSVYYNYNQQQNLYITAHDTAFYQFNY